MSESTDHGDQPVHDPHVLHELTQRDLGLLALGEQGTTAIGDHARTCAICSHDLAAFRQVVSAGRSIEREPDGRGTPPAYVWQRIAAEVGIADVAPAVTSAPAVASPPSAPSAPSSEPIVVAAPSRWRRGLLAAAAVVVLAGTGVAGWAIGNRTSSTTPSRSAEAALSAQPGTSSSARGTATVHTSPDGYTLNVVAKGLPAPTGYYEVWLYNPSVNRMVAVGTLGSGARGSFTVPAGIDLRAYHVVDVSAQRFDGDNTHQRSVLQGPLSP